MQHGYYQSTNSENLGEPGRGTGRCVLSRAICPSSKLPPSLRHDGARILFYAVFKPDFKNMGRLKNNLLSPRKPNLTALRLVLHFKINPLTGRLSVTPLYVDGTPVSGSRTVWKDPENLNDGCSATSIPPPMYCLTRQESKAASLFERIAEQRARRENGGQEGEDDISADGNCLCTEGWLESAPEFSDNR